MAGHSIFINYRRRDTVGYGRGLDEYLRGRFGDDRVFFDRSTIESGDVFPNELCQGVEGCAVLLALIGPQWLDGKRLDDPHDFVRREIALALEQGKKVIPVLFDDTPVPPRDRLPVPLQALASCDALTLRGKTYEYQTQRRELVRLLAKVPGVPPPRPEGAPQSGQSWEQVRNICEDITCKSMSTVQGKYHKGLYLQRNTVRQHVEAFLADREKHGFILVGKSGVGKSNFLLALAEELHARGNVCVLMYDGANLPITSVALTDIISKDFRSRSRQPVQQVWEEIARIDGIGERLVVFCVDAVNENAQATDLLRQLDELVQSPWPWLKIIFSSRPETWRSIKSGVKLAAALYYRELESERLGIELEPFSYSEKMEPFSRQELPQVYSKYKHIFTLQTHYDALSHEQREILRDPLNLYLLARTYRGQTIPVNVKTSALIEDYVNWVLHKEERPFLEKRRFLENQLVTLMVRKSHYSNVITQAELDAAGGALYGMVSDDQKNQAFRELCDADILVLEQQETEQTQIQIKFKYERFYEYFVGKRLADLSETQANRCAFFLELIAETAGKPFFWGAVRNALVKEASKPNSENILKLCRTTEQRVKEMMVNVLTGLDSLQVEGILRNLIPQEKQASEWQKIRQLVSVLRHRPYDFDTLSAVRLRWSLWTIPDRIIFRLFRKKADLQTRSARKITIEVASTLKLGWILQTAALQTDPTMRAMAVRYGYYLWQRDRAAGFAVLQYLAEKAATGVIPNFLAFESVLGLSLIIVCDHYQEEGVLSRLQGIWHGLIAKLFRVREGNNPWKGIVRDVIRAICERLLIAFTIHYVFKLLRELPANNMMNYEALEAFFKLDEEDKATYRRIVRYFDVNGDYSREQMEQDYLAVLKIDNVLPRLTTSMGLVAHACAAPHSFLPFLKQLFEAAKTDIATYPYLTVIFNVPVNVLVRDPMDDEMFDFFIYTAEVCQEYYAHHPEKYHSRYAEAPQAPSMGCYIDFQYRRESTVRTAWLETRIQAALKKPDLKLFEFLLTEEFPQHALDFRQPKAVLAALELFFKSGNEEITHMIQVFLSRLRVYYPDQVEDFLEEQEAPDEFRLQVRTHEPSEEVGDLIGMKAWYFVRDSALLGPAEGRAQLIGFFEKAADYKDTRAWMKYVIRHLVNLIYGGEALRESA